MYFAGLAAVMAGRTVADRPVTDAADRFIFLAFTPSAVFGHRVGDARRQQPGDENR